MEYNPTKPCLALPDDEIRILETKDKLPLIGFHQATYRPTYLTKTEAEEVEEEERVHKPFYHKQPRYSYMSIFPCEVYHVQLLVMQQFSKRGTWEGRRVDDYSIPVVIKQNKCVQSKYSKWMYNTPATSLTSSIRTENNQ